MSTPKILHSAFRQYQHNDCSGLVAGFDYKETVRIVMLLEKAYFTARNAAAGLTNHCRENASTRRQEKELQEAEAIYRSIKRIK